MKIAIAAALVAAAALFGAWRLANARTVQLFGEIVPRVETERRLVALTFDDGPSDQHAGEILDALRERGVRATFFLTGHELERFPELGRRVAAEGHEIGNHSWSHRAMLLRGRADVAG